jgi:hypothetical protein
MVSDEPAATSHDEGLWWDEGDDDDDGRNAPLLAS